MGLGSVLVLALLLIFPVLAMRQITISAKMVTGYAIGITVITWFIYFYDKKRAESGEWRVPESTLHLLEILGGWPSAFVAQRWLRHKTAKTSFKIVFWLIVLIHQYVAMDFLQHWKFTSAVIGLIEHSRGR